MSSDRLDRLYAELLKNHSGWALFNKTEPRDLKPGSFGYFDSDGIWKPIIHLSEETTLPGPGWTPLARRVDVKENRGRIVWDPKSSASIKGYGIGGESCLPVTYAPDIEVSATFRIEGNDDRGAVLVTEAPITNQVVTDDRPLLQWVSQNAKQIVQEYGRQIREHGLWIITKTYTTRSCVMSVLHSKSSKITVGLTVDVSGTLSWNAGQSWSTSSGDTTTVMYEDDDGIVVFVSGIYLTKQILSKRVNIQDRRDKQKFLRDGEQEDAFTIRTTDTDGSDIVLVIQHF